MYMFSLVLCTVLNNNTYTCQLLVLTVLISIMYAYQLLSLAGIT